MESIVRVYNSKNGKWQANAKVVLSWGGFFSGGMSKPTYTDKNGTAIVQHLSKGKADIYVNGKKVDWIETPGSKIITI